VATDAAPSPDSPVPPPAFHEALYRVASVAGRVDDPREALAALLAIFIDVLHASSGTVSLLNPDSGKLEIEVQQGLGLDSDEVPLRLGQGITGWVAFHGRPRLAADVAADPRYISLRPEVRSEMAAPMLGAGGQVLGVVNLDSDVLGGFTDADLAFLVRLTAEATAVMQRLWQLRHLGGKARQLESLITIGQSLVGKLGQQDLFNTVTRDARLVTGGRACAFYLCDPHRQTLRLVSLAGASAAPLPGADDLPLESCLTAAAIHTRRQIEFANIQSPEFRDVIDLPRDDALRSVLAAPVVYENEVLGVLAVFTDHIHRFNNDEKRLLAALAGLGAVALQNSRLYARVFQSEASLRKNEQLTTLGLLAAEIAHEIRNPLTVIKLLFGYLGLEFPDGDPRRTDVRVIGEKLDQLEAIVSRVLNFAKAPSALHSRWSIDDMVGDTLVLLRLKLEQGKIRLRYEPPASPLVVDVHKGQIQQVLLNLLLNSMQAMPDGGDITLRCGTEDRAGARFATLDIIDTGRGIPAHLRDRIFDSFLSGRADGTGLGLSIAKRILLGHRGDITLVSTSPAGTTLRLALPIAT